MKVKNYAMNNLKGVLAFLVVIHHAFLAYTTSGYASQVVDPQNFIGFDYITFYLDNFFMFAFFMISGFFVYNSISCRGPVKYVLSRLLKLGIPFIIGTYIINFFGIYIKDSIVLNFPINAESLKYYWSVVKGMLIGQHLWFLWVLLAFNILILLIHLLTKKFSNKFFIYTKPWTQIILLVVMAAIFYRISIQFLGTEFIRLVGPLTFQGGRIAVYFIIFIFGYLIGKAGIDKTFLGKESPYKKYWYIYLLTGLVLVIFVYLIVYNFKFVPLYEFAAIMNSAAFIITPIGFILLFNRMFSSENKFLGLLGDNAFGIYIIHYSIVLIFQALFLRIYIPGLIKGLSVALISYIVSFTLTYAFRKSKDIIKSNITKKGTL